MRTQEQNAALHLYFRWLAEALRDQDFDFRDLTVEIQASENLVKEYIWRPIQEAMTGKVSTTELEISEVSEIYDTLHRAMVDKLNINVPFPNKEDLERDNNN